MCPSLLETTQRKKRKTERRLWFHPNLQRWRRQRRPDLRRRWKPLTCPPPRSSQAISCAEALPRMVLFRWWQVLLLDVPLRAIACSSPVPPSPPPLFSCSRSMPLFVFLPNRSVFPDAAVSLFLPQSFKYLLIVVLAVSI
jgi:hypothetical protein